MKKYKLSLIFLLIALLFSVAAQSDRSYSADRFDVVVNAQQDGSLAVEESVAFRFVGGPFSFVFRELPTDHTDGITGIVAGVDGVPWPEGTGPGQVEITGRNPIEITWHLSPTSDTVQNFTLSYRVLGVVRREAEADVLDWQALPDEYEYDIASSRVTVNYPSDITLLSEPEVRAGKADVAAAGDGQVVFTQGALSSGDPLVVRLRFPVGAFGGPPPAWQAQQEAQNRFSWAWIVAAAVTLLSGLVAIFAAARSAISSTRKATSYLHKPPVDLPPALAGWLYNQSITWPHGLATLLDLAARGLVNIEEADEKKWYQSADFDVHLLDRPANLRPHERALLDLLFTDKSGAQHDTISMSDMGRLITSSRWKGFSETVEREVKSQGLISAEAKRRGKRLLATGIVLMIVGGLIALLTALFWSLFGLWPLLLAGVVFVLGFFALIAGATVSPLSAQGAKLAETFAPFRRFVQDVSRGKMDVPDPAYFAAYLPYAAAFGHAVPWLKQQARSGYDETPDYFRAVSVDDGSHMVVWIAAVTAATNSGGSAAATAGAAGAAAAGGGASGAG